MRVKCLAQEHNAVSLVRARSRTASSGVERTNHEATAPPTKNTQGHLECQGHSRSPWVSRTLRSRVFMSSLRALCCFPSLKKQKHDFHFSFVQRIIKQLLDSVFVVSKIIKVSVIRLKTLTSNLIILDIQKTSSNSCLKITSFKTTWT